VFFDAHTHTHLRGCEDLEQMALAGVDGLTVCAFLPVAPSAPATVRDLWRWLAEGETARLAGHGIRGRVALGVHPRCIPAEGATALVEELDGWVAAGRAAAVGEIGLETGSPVEQELLARQLRLAARRGVPAVVHTPRANKPAMLEATLAILRAERVDPAHLILDHLTPDLVPAARRLGAVAGLTVQPGKLTATDVLAVVRAHGPDGLVVDSDLSHVASDPLTVPRVARALRAAGLDPAVIERITSANARALFG
jgi:predicted metal-dependent TIM-barrel fold hydrolase